MISLPPALERSVLTTCCTRAVSSLRIVPLIMGVVATVGCTDSPVASDSSGTPGELQNLIPRHTVAACTGPQCANSTKPWTWTVTLGTGNLKAEAVSADTFTFAESTRIRLTVTGQLSRMYNADAPNWGITTGDPYFPLDANAEWLSSDRSGYVYTNFVGTGAQNTSAIGSSPNTPATAAVDSFSILGFARGTGPIRRFAFRQPSIPAPPYCNGMTGIQCVVAVGGQQTVTLEIINAWLSLTATPDSVVQGDTVTFTASSSVGGITVREWQWEPDSVAGATTSAASCGAATTCAVRVYESGTMHVRARVGNGSSAVAERATAHVIASPADNDTLLCPTGNDVLDDELVRQVIDSLWKLGGDSTQGPAPRSLLLDSARRERSAYIVDSAGVLLVKYPPIDSASTPCKEVGSLAWLGENGWVPDVTKIVRALHTHPFAAGDLMPINCSDEAPMVTGPSSRDWHSMKTMIEDGYTAPGFGAIVVEKDRVWTMRDVTEWETLETRRNEPDGRESYETTWYPKSVEQGTNSFGYDRIFPLTVSSCLSLSTKKPYYPGGQP